MNPKAKCCSKTLVAKKMVMAATGLMLFGFLVGHMVGNLKIFQGIDAASGRYKIDVYAQFLRDVGFPLFAHGELLLYARLGLLAAFALHIASAVQVVLASRAARPQGYVVKEYLATNFAARTMWVSGLLILAYVGFHLLHFTTGQANFTGFEHGKVYANVYHAFRVWWVALFYIASMAVLSSHLFHGLWSLFQTLGICRQENLKIFQWVARAIAVGIFLGYAVVPVSILVGIVPPPMVGN